MFAFFGKLFASKLVTMAIIAGIVAVSFGIGYAVKTGKEIKYKHDVNKRGPELQECLNACYVDVPPVAEYQKECAGSCLCYVAEQILGPW